MYPAAPIPGPVPAQVEGKRFITRAVAYILDIIVINLVAYPVGFFVGLLAGLVLAILNIQYPQIPTERTMADFVLSIFLSFIYYLLFEWLYGASLGKIILGMRVIMVDGEPCTFKAAAVRSIYRLVDGLLFAIPAMATMKSPLYQRLGDKAAFTLVVSSGSAKIRKPRPWWWFFIAAGLYLVIDGLSMLFLLISYL